MNIRILNTLNILLILIVFTGCKNYQIHRYAKKSAKMFCKAGEMQDRMKVDNTAYTKKQLMDFANRLSNMESKVKRKFTSKYEQKKLEELIDYKVDKKCKAYYPD